MNDRDDFAPLLPVTDPEFNKALAEAVQDGHNWVDEFKRKHPWRLRWERWKLAVSDWWFKLRGREAEWWYELCHGPCWIHLGETLELRTGKITPFRELRCMGDEKPAPRFYLPAPLVFDEDMADATHLFFHPDVAARAPELPWEYGVVESRPCDSPNSRTDGALNEAQAASTAADPSTRTTPPPPLAQTAGLYATAATARPSATPATPKSPPPLTD